MNKSKIGDIHFDNIQEQDDRYIVGLIRMPNINEKNGNHILKLNNFIFENYVMPDPSDEFSKFSILYEKMNLKDFTLSENGKLVFSINDVEVMSGPINAKDPLQFSLKVSRFFFDLSTLKSPYTTNAMNALGLKTVTGNTYISGSVDAYNTGQFDINEFVFNIDNAGSLKGSLSMSGITMDTMSLIDRVEIEENKPDGSKKLIYELDALIYQRMTIKNIKLRYEDSGLINNAFDYIAKEQGIDPQTLKAVIKSQLAEITADLQSDLLTNEVKTATDIFIDNPKSLEFIIEPENEISMQPIIDKVEISDNPMDDIMKILNIQIIANDN